MVRDPPVNGDNATQWANWSSTPGLKWIDHEANLDQLKQSVNVRLVEKSAAGLGELVLHIGCGTGAASVDFTLMGRAFGEYTCAKKKQFLTPCRNDFFGFAPA